MTLALVLALLTAPHTAPPPDTSFAGLVARLSEPGGFFDTDNLVSNEQSYQHVIGALHDRGVSGGAYLGVGPDQNFSYIVAVRPAIALIIDIRRDNLLLQLLFKQLFLTAHNRLEYLCLLFGRPVPRDLASWNERPLEELLAYVDSAPPAVGRRPVSVRDLGIPLDSQDLAKIQQMHAEFMTTGLTLRLRTFGRPLRLDYPSYRDLLLEKDLEGRQSGYLVREADFRYLQAMQRDGRIVPVVGDLSGSQAMGAITAYLKERRLAVSAFYTSNVEQYLLRDGGFVRFAGNVAALPHDGNSVIIRSYFPNRQAHPDQVPGYNTVQVMQTFTSFLATEAAGGYQSYFELVTRDVLDLRAPRATGIPR